ncbi:MAG: helix-turn-helix transcriptional regulator [Cyclobacteriaceae bacterium]
MKEEITGKQLEVLRLLADGHSSEEIAKELENSKKTIDSIRIDMLRRFQVKNVAHLVAYGFRKGWLK